MFVPTLYFVDATGTSHDTGQSRVSHWCYTRDAGGWCPPATADQTAAFTAGMARCFKHAVAKGMSLAVAPHVDDGTGSGEPKEEGEERDKRERDEGERERGLARTHPPPLSRPHLSSLSRFLHSSPGLWRNGLVFDPLVPYAGLTYADFMLYPLADALRAAMGPATRVWLATQGEMGATVVYHPASHKALLSSLKSRIAAGKPAGTAGRVATGVLTNADKLCQCIRQEAGWGPNRQPPPSYSAQFKAAWPRLAGSFDAGAVRALFEAADFIGFSNYPALPAPAVKAADLEAGITTFATELAAFGVDLPALIARRGTQLFFSEVGVGGGADAWGGSPAADPAAAAAAPFYGVTAGYSPDADPWHRAGSGLGPFLRSFYGALSAYAASRGACPGCKYGGVDGAFLWNCGSWDVEGVHPSSWAGDDPAGAPGRVGGGGRPYTYRDPGIVSLIANHNVAAAGGGGGGGRRPWGEEERGLGAQAASGPAPSADSAAAAALPPPTHSRAAVAAESARLAAAMMADDNGSSPRVALVEVVAEEEGGEEGGPALPGLAGAGPATAVRAAKVTSPPLPAPHDLAAGAADGSFTSFAHLRATLLAAVDHLDLPGGGSGGGRAAAGVGEDEDGEAWAAMELAD